MIQLIHAIMMKITSGAVHFMGSFPLSTFAPSEARPKSATFACPSSDRRTFLAARSRWTQFFISRQAIPQHVSYANPIWSFLVTYCRPRDLVMNKLLFEKLKFNKNSHRKYSNKEPLPMNSVTKNNFMIFPSLPLSTSSMTSPSNRTR